MKKIEKIYQDCPSGYEVDHVLPMNGWMDEWMNGKYICGLHIEYNMQYLTKKENMEKSNKFTPYIISAGPTRLQLIIDNW